MRRTPDIHRSDASISMQTFLCFDRKFYAQSIRLVVRTRVSFRQVILTLFFLALCVSPKIEAQSSKSQKTGTGSLVSGATGSVAGQTSDFRTARERAEDAMNATDYRKASQYLEQWLTAMPADTTSRVLQAMCYSKTALTEKAFQQLELAAQCGLSDLKRLQTEPEFGPL